MQPPFISKSYATVLDIVRFACALVVMVCHTAGGGLFYNGRWPFAERPSHYSVIIFFVLSGLVISASITERQASLKAYAISRLTRIWPVAAAGVAFSIWLHFGFLARTGGVPDGYGAELGKSALLALGFLSQSGFGGDLGWNYAYWSLCYEVWYYALFGAFFFLRGPLRLAILAVMALVAGWKILLLMPVWLAGVWLNRAAWPRTITIERTPVLLLGSAIAMLLLTRWDMPMLFTLRDIVPVSLGLSEWFVSDYVAAIIIVVTLAALRPLAEKNAETLERVARPAAYAAGISFTIYLFHPPVAMLLHLAGLPAGDTVIHLVVPIGLILALCALIAELVERRTPALRRAVTQILASRKSGLATSG